MTEYILRQWQAEAYEEWKRSKHAQVYDYEVTWNAEDGFWHKKPLHKMVQGGTVAVVTGGGKTTLGHMVMFDWLRENPQRQVVVAVPSKRLMHQWHDDLTEMGVGGIVRWGGGSRRYPGTAKVIIGIVNSLRKWDTSKHDSGDRERLLLIDECHRIGSDKNAEIPVRIQHDAILGLSATPKRSDGKSVTSLTGPIVYNYSYREALRDNVIPSFTLRAVECPLTWHERYNYDDYSKDIAVIRSRLSDEFGSGSNFFGIPDHMSEDIPRFKAVCAARKAVVNSSENRMRLLEHLLAKHANDKILLFHESVQDLNKMFVKYKDAYDPSIYHYEIHNQEEQFERWMNGDTNLLLSCRALNEGVNAPECDVAIMLSGPNSVRSRIQTLGRALRGENALIYLVYSPGTTDTKGLGSLVGAGGVPKKMVTHFLWNQHDESIGRRIAPYWFTNANVPAIKKRDPIPAEYRIWERDGNDDIILPTVREAVGQYPYKTTTVLTGSNPLPVLPPAGVYDEEVDVQD